MTPIPRRPRRNRGYEIVTPVRSLYMFDRPPLPRAKPRPIDKEAEQRMIDSIMAILNARRANDNEVK